MQPQLPVAPLAPALRLAIDVVDWLRAWTTKRSPKRASSTATPWTRDSAQAVLPGLGPVYQEVLVRWPVRPDRVEDVAAFGER